MNKKCDINNCPYAFKCVLINCDLDENKRRCIKYLNPSKGNEYPKELTDE